MHVASGCGQLLTHSLPLCSASGLSLAGIRTSLSSWRSPVQAQGGGLPERTPAPPLVAPAASEKPSLSPTVERAERPRSAGGLGQRCWGFPLALLAVCLPSSAAAAPALQCTAQAWAHLPCCCRAPVNLAWRERQHLPIAASLLWSRHGSQRLKSLLNTLGPSLRIDGILPTG